MKPISRAFTLVSFLLLTALVGLASSSAVASEGPTPAEMEVIEAAMIGPSLQKGQEDLARYLTDHPGASDEVRFGLALTEFFRGGERMFQTLHRHGFNPDDEIFRMLMPFPPVPMPVNPNPEPISYDQFRAIVRMWLADLKQAEATLATISAADVKLRVHPGLVRFDLDGSGEATEFESLWIAFNMLGTRQRADAASAAEFDIAFDRGDVSWLRGYCNLLMGMCELVLAYDSQEMFERTAHLVFAKPVTPYTFLKSRPAAQRRWSSNWVIVDWIASIHLTQYPLVDAAGPGRALNHFKTTIQQGREMWQYYGLETDNDREWLPFPGQTSVIPGAQVSKEMQETWLELIDEVEAVLDGRRLLRFWRTADGLGRAEGLGVNVNKVFMQPRDVDLILWIQGTDAQPYLEEGTLTEPGIWTRVESVFNQRVFRHAFWFN